MLLPQEGVALGMCVSAQVLGADGELIRNIILFSVLIYELVGPLATKESLKAAGAITEKPGKSSSAASASSPRPSPRNSSSAARSAQTKSKSAERRWPWSSPFFAPGGNFL